MSKFNELLESLFDFINENKRKLTLGIILICCIYCLLLRSNLNPFVFLNKKKVTDEEKKKLLDLSNEVREKCDPTIQKLEWDNELEEFATKTATYLAHARGCKLEHTDSYSELKPAAGENLAMSRNMPDSIKAAINGWASEGYEGKFNYYSAMNWKSANKIGCGISKSGCGTVIACNYRSDTGSPFPNLQGFFEQNVTCKNPIKV